MPSIKGRASRWDYEFVALADSGFEQGLFKRLLQPEELFVSESLESFRI
ncbi:MAG TPA: hypothetical protein VF814_00260 [Casimicrobiaceae bacterium]